MALQEFNFADLVTFTRGSTGTFVGSNGNIQTAAIDEPRFQYDPVTLARKGLLVEPQSTNNYLTSNVSNADTADGATISAPYDSGRGFDVSDYTVGTQTTGILGAWAPNSSVGVLSDHTVSCIVSTNARYIYFSSNAAGAQTNVGAVVGYDTSTLEFLGFEEVNATYKGSSIKPLGGNFFRVSISLVQLVNAGGKFAGVVASNLNVNPATFSQVRFAAIGYANSEPLSVGAWQIEPGLLATSYIPTAGSGVTRLQDFAQADFQTNPTLAAAFLANQGTWYIDVNDAQDAELFTGIGHWNKYTGSGTIVFRYDTNDAYLHIPGSYPIRFGRDAVAAGIMDFIKDNVGVVGRVRYEDFMVTEAEAEAATSGTLEALFFIDDAHRAATSFASRYQGKNVELLPVGIFEQSPSAGNFTNVYFNNEITSIPSGIFGNNPSASSFGGAFRLNPITTLPSGLFQLNPNASSFASCFLGCSITTVPSGFFDNQTVCTNYTACFSGAPNALTQQSVENVLVSINTSAQANNLDNGTLGIRGDGSALSAAAQAAKTALEGRGWVITLDNIA